MSEHQARRLNRIVVQLARPAGDNQATAAALAASVPGGRVVRVSQRGRVVIALEAQPDSVLASLTARSDVEWAEADVVDRAQ